MESNNKTARKESTRTWLTLLAICVIGISTILFAKEVGGITTVYGQSMQPTIRSNSKAIVLSSNIDNNYEIDDIVTFKNECTGTRTFIKRIVGIEGDTIQIKDGYLYRNGVRVDDGFDRMDYAGLLADPVTLGKDEFIVLGDNRNNSTDSRMIGIVKKEDIVYKYISNLFPWES